MQHLPDDEKAELKTFEEADVNKDGKISVDEAWKCWAKGFVEMAAADALRKLV